MELQWIFAIPVSLDLSNSHFGNFMLTDMRLSQIEGFTSLVNLCNQRESMNFSARNDQKINHSLIALHQHSLQTLHSAGQISLYPSNAQPSKFKRSLPLAEYFSTMLKTLCFVVSLGGNQGTRR